MLDSKLFVFLIKRTRETSKTLLTGFSTMHSGISKVGHIHKQKAQPPINCGVGIDAYEKTAVPIRGK